MHPQPPPAIHLTNVGFRRGTTWILKNITWTVPQSTCAAILGPNGSGKSTLTRILACHDWPTEGHSSILGHTFGDASLLDLRKSIRLVQPAGPYDIDPDLTAHQVVLTGFFATLNLYDPTTPEMESEATRLLAQVGLPHRPDHPYHTLSSGEKVRTLIARALVKEPKLLLLDEPTAGLDLLAREQVLATIQALFEPPTFPPLPPSPGTPGEGRGEGSPSHTKALHFAEPRPPSPLVGEGGGEGELSADQHTSFAAPPPTVILITHHVEELPPATTQILLLDQGTTAASGPPTEVLTPQTLSKVYNCPVTLRTTAGRHYLEVHPTAWRDLLHRPT